MINSAEEFVRLRNSELPEDYLRSANEEAPIHVWYDILLRFPTMREWVVHNRTVPLEILEVLACDKNASVRAAVAEKRKLSESLFEVLSSDECEVVRQRIAYNKKAPFEIIEKLSCDPSELVRKAAIKRLKKHDF